VDNIQCASGMAGMRTCCCVWACVVLLAAAPARAQRDRFELVGIVLRSDGQPFPQVTPLVFLDSASSPFTKRGSADPTGEFRFKGIPTGTYTLIIHVPRAGESRRTVEVGPSVADSKGRIRVEVRLERSLSQDNEHLISATRLALPAEAKDQYLRAMAQLESDDVQGAIASLQKATEIAPRFPEAWNHLGTIAYTTRRYEDAERYFRSALEQDPDAYDPLVNLGGTLIALRRLEESLTLNQRAVRLKPEDPLAHSQLGMSYYHLEQYAQAEEQLRLAKSLDPGHFTFPQLLLASIYARRNERAEAIRELEDFLKLHPDSERVPRVRAQIRALREEMKAPSLPPRP
jgi:tetratricopeptide (TPR) repeat protein